MSNALEPPSTDTGAHAAHRSRVGFFTPSFHTLGRNWRRDTQIVKLAAPQISGALFANGYRNLRQYDFEVQIFELEMARPGVLDLKVFFDDAAVDRFLAADDIALRHQTELILDTLEVEKADLFALSCASVLEIYADMHAAANLNLCVAKVLKERFPDCRTIVGGLKISPDTKHRAEFLSMLERCRALDFAAEGRGEAPLLNVLEHLETGRSFESMNQHSQPHGHGLLLLSGSTRELHLSPGLARDLGFENSSGVVEVVEVPDAVPAFETLRSSQQVALPLSSTTSQVLSAIADAKRRRAAVDAQGDGSEFGPQGEHERREIFNPSIFVTPWFDRHNIERRKMSGGDLLRNYHLGPEWQTRLGAYRDDQIAILPMVFMEGCNARCAFCAYSMTKMVKRDVAEVVRAMAWMREHYDVRYFHFLNTNINGSLQYAEAFCDALIDARLDVLWSDCANLWALNERLLEKMRRSGAIRFTYGVECPSDRMLHYIGKGITVKQAHQRLKQASDLGIWNHLLLITGLPTETEDDTKHFVDFLEESSPFANAYSISSFYLISSSLMGAFPDRYGLQLLPNTSGLLEDQAFQEVGGLSWSDKKRQIVRSTEVITEAIRRIKQDPKYWSGAIDLELLFWLYDRLGHDHKADIVRCYEDGFLSAPAHPKNYAPALHRCLDRDEGPAVALRRAGLRAQADQLRIAGDTMSLPVEAGEHSVELQFRVAGYGSRAGLIAGRNLGVSVAPDHAFRASLDEVLKPGSRLLEALERVGWSVQRELPELGPTSFRLVRDAQAIDLEITSVGPSERVFLRHEGLGLSYRVPHGHSDATQNPKTMAMLQRIGTYLLHQLAADPRTLRMRSIDLSAVRRFATAVVEDLESVFSEEIQAESPAAPVAEPRRHGDKYSRVAVA